MRDRSRPQKLMPVWAPITKALGMFPVPLGRMMYCKLGSKKNAEFLKQAPPVAKKVIGGQNDQVHAEGTCADRGSGERSTTGLLALFGLRAGRGRRRGWRRGRGRRGRLRG